MRDSSPQYPPGATPIRIADRRFPECEHLFASRDDNDIIFKRRQDGAFYRFPLAELLPAPFAEMLKQVKSQAQRLGVHPFDHALRVATTLQAQEIDQHGQAIVNAVRPQAERAGQDVSVYVRQLAQIGEWAFAVRAALDALGRTPEDLLAELTAGPSLLDEPLPDMVERRGELVRA